MTAHRSSVSRILSASAASWVHIGITIMAQLALVPLYLSSWDADVFGAWLLLQAAWSVLTILDAAHCDYVGYECLRLGAGNRTAIARVILSASPMVLLIALGNLLLVWLLGKSGLIEGWIGHDPELIDQWLAALLLQAATWIVTSSQGGLIARWLTPFGYYPQLAWWIVVESLVAALAPCVAVFYYGADLWGAALALCTAQVAFHLFFFAAMARIISREGFFSSRPSLALGARQAAKSLWLMAKNLAEMARQHGVRLVLTPLAGVVDMAAFSTMRTGANFALQGLNTVTGPVMPELMRFLVARDQQRTESAFAIVWLVLCLGLSPAVLVVQYAAPAVYPLWTRGKFAFDPWLFGMLSLGVLVYALAQPAIAIIRGNNVLRPQLFISFLAAGITVGGMIELVPRAGIRGAAFVLLLAELVSLLAYLSVASRWLQEHDMGWPWRAFSTAFVSVAVAAAGMAALAQFPGVNLECLVTALALEAAVVVVYWRCLPLIARQRAVGLATRFVPGLLRGKVVTAFGGPR